MTSKRLDAKKFVVTSDWHVPDEDKNASAAFCEFLKDFRPDGLVIAGDFLDIPELSRHNAGSVALLEGKRLSASFDAGNRVLDKIDAAAGKQCKTKYFLGGNHECVSEDTEVLTASGWKAVASVTTNDEVLSSTSDGIGQWKPVTATRKYPYTGDMLRFKNRRVDSLVTPTHRVWSASPDTGFGFTQASEFTDSFARIVFQCAATNTSPDLPGVTDDEISILGWMLTDCYYETKRICFYQRPAKVGLITSVLDRMGVAYTRTERTRDIQQVCGKVLLKKPQPEVCVRVGAQECKRLLSLVGPEYKALPQWAYNLSTRQVGVLLSSMLDGNGTRPKTSNRCAVYYPSNKARGSELQALLVRNGYATTLVEYRDNQYRLNIVRDGMRTQLNGQGRAFTIGAISRENYAGNVYCITVKDNENFCFRRNGAVAWTGNSRIQRWTQSGDNAVFKDDPILALDYRLRLPERGYYYEPNYPKGYVKLGKLFVIHGTHCNKHAAATHLERFQASVVFGHTHRPGMHHSATFDGQRVGVGLGHMADVKSEAMDYAPVPSAWVHGFAVVYVHEDGHFNIIPINFANGVFYWGDKRYGRRDG